MEMEATLPNEHDWPERLLTWINGTYGAGRSVEQLAGMSLSGVWRVRLAATSLIVKASPSAFEAGFYEQAAPSLRAAGIPIPDLYLSLHEPERHWLVIEDIPEPLPDPQANEWKPDRRMISILTRLHAVTRAKPPDLPVPPSRGWTDMMTAAALDCLPTAHAATLRPLLTRLQAESVPVFEPWCWISGDPNPRNWGLRAGGTPVLFDWELFSPGNPATDLAIIIPGLGDMAAYQRTAAAYLAAWDSAEPPPWDTATLARQIAVAKVATVVQLLHGHATGNANVGDEIVTWLADVVPTWIQSLHDTGTGTSGNS